MTKDLGIAADTEKWAEEIGEMPIRELSSEELELVSGGSDQISKSK